MGMGQSPPQVTAVADKQPSPPVRHHAHLAAKEQSPSFDYSICLVIVLVIVEGIDTIQYSVLIYEGFLIGISYKVRRQRRQTEKSHSSFREVKKKKL